MNGELTMQNIDNTIGKSEKEILASLKGETLDAVMITVRPSATSRDNGRSEFSLTDVLLRTTSREVLLHLSERESTTPDGECLYALEITSNPIHGTTSSLSGEQDENGQEIPGWYDIRIGKTIREVQTYTDRNSCTILKDGNDIPVWDTSVIALTFDDSCLVLAKVAFMDNWRVIFQDSPHPDVGGLMNMP